MLVTSSSPESSGIGTGQITVLAFDSVSLSTINYLWVVDESVSTSTRASLLVVDEENEVVPDNV